MNRKPGVGSLRQYWRIREYLYDRRTSLAELQRELKMSATTIYATARGQKNNRRVLRRLLEMGVPAEVLDLPDDMKAEAGGKKKEVA